MNYHLPCNPENMTFHDGVSTHALLCFILTTFLKAGLPPFFFREQQPQQYFYFIRNKHYYIFIIYLANMIRHTLLSRFQMPAPRSPIITITTHPKRKERLPAVYIDSLISLQLVERLTHLHVKNLTEFQQVSLPSFQCHRRSDGCKTNMQRTLSPTRPIYRKIVKY